jgi:hypothetical protein
MSMGKWDGVPTEQVQHIKQSKFICSSCGSARDCDCNAPARLRAIEAVKVNPEKSDRAIAKDVGASPTTVGKARGQVSTTGHLNGKKTAKGDANTSPTKRIGRDGKAYPAKQKPTRKPSEQKPNAPHASPELCDALDEAERAAKEIKKRELDGGSATFLLFCLNSHLAAINKVVTAIEKKYSKKLRLFQEDVAAEKAKQAQAETATS